MYTGTKTEAILIGSATTTRHSLMWNEQTEICLDYTTYLGTEDYEIEIEFTGDCPEKLLEELKTFGVEFKDKSVGKYSRFIKQLQSIIDYNTISVWVDNLNFDTDIDEINIQTPVLPDNEKI